MHGTEEVEQATWQNIVNINELIQVFRASWEQL